MAESDLMLEDMSVHDGGIDMTVSGDTAQRFYANLIRLFKQAGSKNFLTLSVSNKAEKYAITIQDCNGADTPEEKIKRLTAENAALKEANQWIPVSEKLPEDGAKIFVANIMTGAQYVSHKDLIYFNENKEAFVPISYLREFKFTHWRPLPKPPQKG